MAEYGTFQYGDGPKYGTSSPTEGGLLQWAINFDWNGDGRYDLLVNSENVNLLINSSQSGPPWHFTDAGPLSNRKLAGHTTSPTTVDWDGDGVRDLLVGAEDGYLYHVQRD